MKTKRIQLILDTDIGPDCDDVGALALLHILARKYPTDFLAMTNCTSNPYACGTIDAINRCYGQPNIPIGTYEKSGFLEEGYSQKYNRYITENYENAYRPPSIPPGALSVLKKALIGAENNSITFLSIGPLNNLANLICDAEGQHLVKDKVSCLVTMSTGLAKPEWNVLMDIPAAQEVFENWPSPIVISVFETGASIITGRSFGSIPADHPLPVSYRLHADGDEKRGRMSWDLTAAWYALAGTEPFFYLSSPYNVSIDTTGLAQFQENPQGRFRILHNRIDPELIAQHIDSMWTV
jgi:inosine-uridine nucleoside N-ribohydrolase